MSSERSVEVHVHEGDDPRIVRILDLIDEAARPRPLAEVLGVLCAEVAAIVEAQVASVYVRDDDEDATLVMRANVGFPGGAVDQVRLPVGEGITGFAAECMRPVTVRVAADDAHFKAVPGLDEAAFPIFLALPILVGRRAEAVLVLQRRGERPFDEFEVVLATALATSFAYALERARARAEEQEADAAPRKAHLRGRRVTQGAALGRVETSPTFDGLAALCHTRGLDAPLEPDAARARLLAGLSAIRKGLRKAADRLEERLAPEARAALASFLLVGEDQRFVSLLEEAALAHPNPAHALRQVARVYARAPYEVGADKSSTERSNEAEALCLAIAAHLADVRAPSQGAALMLTDRLPALLALLAIDRRASALALSGRLAEGSLAAELARAGALPVVSEVGGLFAWARVGDRVLIDADEGVVRVNPSAATVARFRRQS